MKWFCLSNMKNVWSCVCVIGMSKRCRAKNNTKHINYYYIDVRVSDTDTGDAR